MNLARDYLERLRHARTRMKHRILGVAEHAIISHGRNRRILFPEVISRVRIAAHRTVEDNLRAHRDDEFDAEVRPLLADRRGDIVRARDAHELVEVSARANRNDWLMPDEHQRPHRLNLCEAFADRGDLTTDLLDQHARLRPAIYS